LGSYYTFNITAVGISGNDSIPASGVPIPSAGIWLINYQIRIKPGISVGTVTRFYTEVYVASASVGGMIEDSSTQNLNGAQFITHNGFAIATVTNSTSTVYINTVTTITVGPLETVNSFIKIMRIA